MALQPLDSVPGTQAEAPSNTFAERTMQRLQGEKEADVGSPQQFQQSESAEDVSPEEAEYDAQAEYEAQDDEGYASEAEEDTEGALLGEESPEDSDESEDTEAPEEGSAEYWEARFRGAEKALSKATENRRAIEKEFADGISENITFRHNLEDLNNQAQQRAEFFLNLASQTVNQWEQLDWNQVPPEEIGKAKAQYQQAVAQRDQLTQALDQVSKKAAEDREISKTRQAEISRSVLQRRIPDWSDDKYREVMSHGMKFGFDQKEMTEIVDWRVIMLLHNDMQTQQATEKVQQLKTEQKAKRPRNRNARQQPRNAQGRFRKSKDEAFAKPGDKGAFRQMMADRLAIERERGRR